MQGLQKIKCASCGTMFMSETETQTCPSCSEQSHSHQEHGTGGCGSATEFFLPIQHLIKVANSSL